MQPTIVEDLAQLMSLSNAAYSIDVKIETELDFELIMTVGVRHNDIMSQGRK